MKSFFKLLICVLLVGILAFSLKSVTKANITNSSAIKNYSQYYSAISNCITKRQTSITLKISNYSETTYNINLAIKQVTDKNSNLKYIISSVNSSGEIRGKITTINYSFAYVTCDYVINDINGFYNSVVTAIKSHKENIKMKINNYNSKYSIENIGSKLDKVKLPYEYSFGNSIVYSLPGLSNREYEVNINYSQSEVGKEVSTNTISDLSSLSESVKNAMKNGDSGVTFKTQSSDKMTFEAFSDIVDKAINENTEYRYFTGWNKTSSIMGNIGTYNVIFSLNFTKADIISMENQIEKKIKTITTALIKPGMTDYDKELKLHDYIVNNSVYDYQNFSNNSVPNIDYTAFGVLINGTGVCEGYSYAIKRLMTSVGIDCRVIVGNVFGGSNGPHAWNIVKLGGQYYQLDATFDDPIVNNGTKNTLSHGYFNLTDSQISKDHAWDTKQYPICNGSTYKYK